MDRVFKYCDAYGVEILRDLELKITPPNQFNDPFEFSPRVICSSPTRKVKRILKNKDELREMFLEDKRIGDFKGNFRQFRERIRKARPNLLAAVKPTMPDANAKLQAKYLKIASTHLGVLCMSQKPSSIIMWGHYSDKHRGLVIAFDNSWNGFRAAKGLRRVNYVCERVLYDSSWVHGGLEEQSYTDRLFFNKNIEWDYEEELRQVFLLRGLKRRPLADKNTGYFLPIPPEIVLSVSLGTRCSAELEEKVRFALRDPRLTHVKLDRAKLHESDFALKFG